MGLMYRVIRKYRDEMNICTFEPKKPFINHENFLNVYFDRYSLHLQNKQYTAVYSLIKKSCYYSQLMKKLPSRSKQSRDKGQLKTSVLTKMLFNQPLNTCRRHKDLKLLLNLLAETSGLPESFRILTLFDKKFQTLWKPQVCPILLYNKISC